MTKKLKNYFILPIIAIIVISFFSCLFSSVKVYAEGSSNTNLINGNFNSTSTSEFPKQPSNWTTIYNDEKNSSIISGVIDVDDSIFETNKTKYGLNDVSNPGNSTATEMTYTENNVLMLNSGNTKASFGYKSKDITFEKDSYYKITVDVYTTADTASIYITGLIKDADLDNVNSFILIKDANTWKKYTIYLKTTTLNKTGNIELWLGTKNNTTSNGIAFFDNVDYKIISNSEYYTAIKNDSNYNKTFDLTKNQQVESDTFNGNFERDLDGYWNKIYGKNSNSDDTTIKVISVKDNDEFKNLTNDDVKDVNSYNNTQALILHTEKTKSFGVESNNFSIKQHGIYRISVYAYCKTTTGSAMIKIIENDDIKTFDKYYSPVSKEYTFSSNKSNTQTNDYNLYSFYIVGNPFYDTSVKLQLWLGTDDVLATGYVLYDDVTFRSIKYEDLISETKNGDILIDLASGTTNTISNGLFNLTKNENEVIHNSDGKVIYPLSPKNWTYSSNTELSDNYYSHGVVNINDNIYFSSYNPGTPLKDIVDNNNNILVLENKSLSYSSYTSDLFTLTKSSKYRIEYYVKTALSDVENNNGVSITLIDENGKVLTKTENLNTNKEWTKYTIYFNTGVSDIKVKFILSLGENDSKTQGSAYFDNFICSTNSLSDEKLTEKYKNLSSTDKWIDLTNIFTTKDEEIKDGYYSSTALVNNLDNNYTKAIGGLISYEDSKLDYKTALKIENFKANTTTFKTAYNYVFTKSKYYLVSVDIKTSLTESSENFGAIFKLEKYSTNYFNFINTNNEVVTYNFVLKTDSDDVKSDISFGLFSANDSTLGYVIFDNLSITEINETQYNTKIKDNTLKLINLNSTTTDNSDTNNTDDDNSNTDNTNNTNNTDKSLIWIYISTIVTAVAILVALIVVLIKKLNKRPRKKKKVKKYNKKNDKNKIITKNINKKQVIDEISDTNKKIENEIKELENKLENLTNDYNSKLISYKDSKEKGEEIEEISVDNYLKTKKQLEKEILKKQKELKLNKSNRNKKKKLNKK